ncbi:MAG: hypothetical protein KOO63_06085 [Bacteroidales bacterium]|nr:hypothetical protein [Candidatus Latescibacterota bacterium]
MISKDKLTREQKETFDVLTVKGRLPDEVALKYVEELSAIAELFGVTVKCRWITFGEAIATGRLPELPAPKVWRN